MQPKTLLRNVPLGYLRAFLVVLVVLHHAVLAYATFAPPQPASLDANLLWTAFPIVDLHRWSGADLVVSFNDSFFMSLMFLLSGVFAWSALARKGTVRFLQDRVRRLGLPFLVSAGVLAPLAYCAAWMSGQSRTVPFWHQWLALGVWPAGPAWFLWVLLAFSLLVALAFRLGTGWSEALGRMAGSLGRRPWAFFSVLLVLSALVYLPAAAMFGPERWIKAGPFFVQVSRVPLYLLYFLAGLGLGAHGREHGLLQADGRLATRWWVWSIMALAAFAVSVGTLLVILGSLQHGGPSPGLAMFGNFTFVLSCTTSSLAFLALFLRFARCPSPIFDSLDVNAYGIYLLHYACVAWLQWTLLPASLPGYAKALLVFVAALATSWSLSALLRRVPAVARVV